MQVTGSRGSGHFLAAPAEQLTAGTREAAVRGTGAVVTTGGVLDNGAGPMPTMLAPGLRLVFSVLRDGGGGYEGKKTLCT